jgi:hypothetical protein
MKTRLLLAILCLALPMTLFAIDSSQLNWQDIRDQANRELIPGSRPSARAPHTPSRRRGRDRTGNECRSDKSCRGGTCINGYCY